MSPTTQFLKLFSMKLIYWIVPPEIFLHYGFRGERNMRVGIIYFATKFLNNQNLELSRHLWYTWIFMYVSCMYHVLIHTDTYMNPCFNTWKIHEISCIMYWQILKLLLMVYSIISAIKFRKIPRWRLTKY